MASFDSGLYYPYTHFRNAAWLKTAALYYDEIARVVPDPYETRDSIEVEELTEAGILKRLDHTESAEAVADEFIDYLARYLSDKKQRELLFRARADTE